MKKLTKADTFKTPTWFAWVGVVLIGVGFYIVIPDSIKEIKYIIGGIAIGLGLRLIVVYSESLQNH